MARPAISYNTFVQAPYTVTITEGGVVTNKFSSENDWLQHVVVKPPSSPTDPAVKPRAMTNFSSFHRDQIVAPSAYHTTAFGDGLTFREINGSSPFVIVEDVNIPTCPDWMVNSALQTALLKLRDGHFDLGVAMAEARETAGTVDQSVKRISKSVDHFRAKNPKKVWRDIAKGRNIPNSWLELQYGWTPLLSDIVGSMAACEFAEDQEPPYIRTTGWTGDSEDNTGETRFNGDQLVLGMQTTSTFLTRTVLQYALDNPALVKANSLGLLDPAAIAWERVPYSFVVDWFLPVGDWLSARSADYGWRFIQGCSTQYVRTFAAGVGNFYTWANGANSNSCSIRETASMRGHRFYRTTFAESPTPVLLLKNPLSDEPSYKRALSGSALLAQRFR